MNLDDTVVRTTCPYCGVGCGLLVSPDDEGGYKVRGDKDHPANHGRLCSKGSALGETLSLDDRLLTPVLDGEACDWDTALAAAAGKFSSIIEQHGPDAVAFYVSGQLLTEDYYVANKLMKGFIGSANIDTNSRLCMSSSVAGHKRAFGSDTVPGCYEDLEQCDLLVLTGSNTAWCHPVLYQRIVNAKKDRPDLKVVVIDPRRTPTCDIADLHLPLQPGTDTILFGGLLTWLYQHGYGDTGFVEKHTENLRATLDAAAWYAPSLTAVAELCGIDEGNLRDFYRWFAQTDKTITVYSQGVNQSSSGTDKVNAIINCHLLTGRIGKPGMGPFSVTGQPNAMGGREVGALSNQLAAHMDFAEDDVDRIGRFWGSDNMANAPGKKAVEMFEAIESGDIKALWVIATNPAVSMPDAGRVRSALEKCEFLVVSDCMQDTDTMRYADLRLPALAWGEKSGTVTNSERCISRQLPFLDAPGESKADWWILSEFARHMGYQGFEYTDPLDIFSEHAALSAFENDGNRDFDLGGLHGLNKLQYDGLAPVHWPVTSAGESPLAGKQRMFTDGRFFTPSGKARFVTVNPRPPGRLGDPEYPLILNTGRIRDQWHTMTRTGKSPRLNGHIYEPFAELHPLDSQRLSITEGQLVTVESHVGEILVRARISESQRPGSIFVPMHWNDCFASNAAVDKVVNAYTDPVSGQPEFKHTPVRVTAWEGAWYGFVLSRQPIDATTLPYWVSARRKSLYHYELAGHQAASDWSDFTREMLKLSDDEHDWIEFFDSANQAYRGARFIGGRLESCVFISGDYSLPPRDWLMGLFDAEEITRQQRLRLLSGIPGDDSEDQGAIVCSCFSVGRNTLCDAVKNKGLVTPEQIGEALQAGTNCGSCVPELRQLIADTLASAEHA